MSFIGLAQGNVERERVREQEPEVNKIVCECANVESLWQGKAAPAVKHSAFRLH